MRQCAQGWRGVTALQPENTDEEAAMAAKVVHFPPDPANVSAQVQPPTYGLKMTKPIHGGVYILPYRSVISPSAMYMAGPLNEYVHLSEWSPV